MNVLLVFSSSELGGAERSLTRMALASTGEIEYSLATLDGHGPWVDWCREIGGSPLVLGERTAHGAHGCFGFKTLRRLATLVRRERFAVLYVIGLRASLWVRLMRPWLAGARLVHGIRWNPDSNSRLDRAFRAIERLLGGLIDLYICNSRVAAETLVRRAGVPRGKVRVSYNGVDMLPQHSAYNRPKNVVTVANLSPRKGYLEYLKGVVEPIVRSRSQTRFVIVGRDEMDGAVQRKASELDLDANLELAGFCSDVSSKLELAQVFVLPSLWNEGCPTSILEAMAHGLPVVAFAIDGIPELVEHQIDGILVSPGDYEAMSDALELLLADSDRATSMGQAGRAKVATQFTLTKSAATHGAIFAEIQRP